MHLAEAVEIALELMPHGGVAASESNAIANLRWANSGLTTNGDTRDSSLSIATFVPVDGSLGCGIASGQVTTRADIEALVEKAKSSAVAGGSAEDAAELISGSQSLDYFEDPINLDTGVFTELASGLGEAFATKDHEYFGYAEQSSDTLYVGTSSGLRFRQTNTSSRFELCGKSTDRTKSAWSGQSGTNLHQVDVNRHVNAVIDGLAHQDRKIDLDPGKYQTLLSPSAVADLMIYLMWSASAREAAEGRSAFSQGDSTKIGNRLTSLPLQLVSDPNLPGLETLDKVVALGSSSMSSTFDTGAPIPATSLIKDGVLTGLISSRFSAKEAGLEFTPVADNMSVSVTGKSGSLNDLAARMDDGLLVTCLWYIREVDPQNLLLTGLTRDGVYVVKNGEIVGATNNFRFNESPLEMLNRISDAGTAVDCLPREWADWFTKARVSPLRIDGFNLSTKSDAV